MLESGRYFAFSPFTFCCSIRRYKAHHHPPIYLQASMPLSYAMHCVWQPGCTWSFYSCPLPFDVNSVQSLRETPIPLWELGFAPLGIEQCVCSADVQRQAVGNVPTSDPQGPGWPVRYRRVSSQTHELWIRPCVLPVVLMILGCWT